LVVISANVPRITATIARSSARKGGSQFFGEGRNLVGSAVQLCRSVLERGGPPPISVPDADEHLDGMTIGHDVAAAGRDHPDDRVQQPGSVIEVSNASNHSHIHCNLMIGEDRFKLFDDGRASVHLTAIEADHQCIVSEAVGVRTRVLLVPSFEDRAMQLLEISGPARVGHLGMMLDRGSPLGCKMITA
jgi:hypothetical protein